MGNTSRGKGDGGDVGYRTVFTQTFVCTREAASPLFFFPSVETAAGRLSFGLGDVTKAAETASDSKKATVM